MTSPSTIAASQLARLAGLSERHLRRLADEGWFPRPVRNQYPLVEAIVGLLRHCRDQHDNPTVRDVYPSLEACAVGTGIPVGLLQRAKRQGCPALSGKRVEIGPFLRWWYGKGKEMVADYERERAERMVLQNTKLRMARGG